MNTNDSPAAHTLQPEPWASAQRLIGRISRHALASGSVVRWLAGGAVIHSFIVVALLLLTSLGCQRSEVLGKVSGTVTLDAKPVPSGMVIFANPQKGVYMTATLDAEGKYAVQSAGGFGLPLGNYQIAVNPPLPQPTMPGAPQASHPPTARIPAKYLRYETSGLTLTVSEGENRQDIAMRSDNRG